jgi:hypothetical protein
VLSLLERLVPEYRPGARPGDEPGAAAPRSAAAP